MNAIRDSMEYWRRETAARADAIIEARSIAGDETEQRAIDTHCHILAQSAIVTAGFANCDREILEGMSILAKTRR